MPNKYSACFSKIVEILEVKKPEKILEVGRQCGKIALTIRGLLEQSSNQINWNIQIDALQFQGENNLINRHLYNNFYTYSEDTVELISSYDVIIQDGFLNYKKDNVNILLDRLLSKSGYVIIFCPFYKTANEDLLWSLCDFPDYDIDYFRSDIDDAKNQHHIFCFKRKNLSIISHENSLPPVSTAFKPLTIAYILPHKNLTGGVKMLLEQMKALKQRGHKIVILIKGQNIKTAIPDWYNLTVDEEIIVPPSERFSSYTKGVDIIVLGWIDQLLDFKESTTPALYWEQGNEWLFGDIDKISYLNKIDAYLRLCYSVPCELASVSPFVSKILHTKFSRTAPVILNGVDTDLYCPGEPCNENKILLVGNPQLAFKGFNTAFKALDLVWQSGYRFSVDWVSQIQPRNIDCKYPINHIIKPPQKELISYYQRADIFLFTSWYEGFGMPPLEAMACGTPVVCTNCGGTDAYVKDKFNALTAEPGDVGKLSAEVVFLLNHENARQVLSKNARETAMRLSFQNTISSFESYLCNLISKKTISPP